MRKKKSRFVGRYWGYLLLAGAVVLLFGFDVGPLVLAGTFALCFVWILVAAPTWCGAMTRTGEPCRMNSSGLLRGCTYRQHKWQRIRALTRLDTAGNVFRGWFTGAQQQVATLGLFVAAIGVASSLIK